MTRLYAVSFVLVALLTPTIGSAAEPRIPSPRDIAPRGPDIKLHPRQPELDLRNTAAEHRPTYAPPKDQFVGLFAPFRTERAALSPDGKYLAYTVRDNGTIAVVIVEIDHPEKITARVTVASDETSTPMLAENQQEKTPSRVRWMRWTTPTRLVVETNGAFAVSNGGSWTTRTGAVFGMDADGRNARLLASPRDVLEQLPDESTLPPAETQNSHTIWSPDQPIPTPGADPAVDGTSASDPLAPDVVTPPESTVKHVAQDIRVYDLAPNDPGCVLLQTSGTPTEAGARHLGFELLNTITGKLTNLTYDLVPGQSRGLTDRVGHVRLTLPVTLLAPFPHGYQYLGATGSDHSRELDTVIGSSAAGGFTVSPENFFGRRAIPVAFDEDPNVLYYAANAARDTFGVYSLNLATGKRGAIQIENPVYDLVPPVESFTDSSRLVIDRFYHRLAGLRFDAALRTAAWIYPSFQAAQKALEQALPGHSVDILEWDQTGHRLLVLATAPGDAGAYYIFDRNNARLAEFARRAPWIDAKATHRTYPIAFKTANNLPLTGLLTVPNHPRLTPMPVIVLCPDMPWERVRPDFSNRVQALAEMGFVVVQINGRGAWGFGLKHREALSIGYDLVQVEDLIAALDYLGANFKVDPKRVAIMGDLHGGFIALRALQLHPERFRCAVAVNAPVDLAAWLEEQRWTEGAAGPALTRSALGDAARLKEAPLARHPELIKRPVLMLHYPGADGAPRASTYLAARNLAEAVRRRATDTEFVDLSTDYMRGYPQAQSDAFQQIENFLNVTVYDYKVKMGDAQVQPDNPPKR